MRFIVDDQRHCQKMGEYDSFEDAKIAILGLVSIAWDEPPNRAPCRNWKNCGREYHIIETDESNNFVSTKLICKYDQNGPIWFDM